MGEPWKPDPPPKRPRRPAVSLGDSIRASIADDIPQLARGRVWCRTCGATHAVNSAQCLRTGWPKCCGYTMTIDSPEERAALDGRKGAK